MRVTNCKTVCLEIEEADARQHLTASAIAHLRSCAECQAFYDERLKLRQLVAGLGGVEAPPDFDFRLRARLANERPGSRSGFLFGRLSLGFPSIALGTVILLVGGAFALRVWNASPTRTNTVRSETQPLNSSDSRPSGATAGVKQDVAVNESSSQSARNESSEPTPKTHKQKSASAGTVASLPRKGQDTREFSVTPANVVRHDAVASLEHAAIFPIETSSQPLRVSLDYATGISRTISVPALSFGSQRVTGDGTPLVKSSNKGDW